MERRGGYFRPLESAKAERKPAWNRSPTRDGADEMPPRTSQARGPVDGFGASVLGFSRLASHRRGGGRKEGWGEREQEDSALRADAIIEFRKVELML